MKTLMQIISKDSKELIKSLFHSNIPVCIVKGDDSHYVGMNEAYCNLVGYTEEELLKSEILIKEWLNKYPDFSRS